MGGYKPVCDDVCPGRGRGCEAKKKVGGAVGFALRLRCPEPVKEEKVGLAFVRLDNLPFLHHIVVLHQGEEAGFALVRQDGLVSQHSSGVGNDQLVCLESTTEEEVGIAFGVKGCAGVPTSFCTLEGRL